MPTSSLQDVASHSLSVSGNNDCSCYVALDHLSPSGYCFMTPDWMIAVWFTRWKALWRWCVWLKWRIIYLRWTSWDGKMSLFFKTIFYEIHEKMFSRFLCQTKIKCCIVFGDMYAKNKAAVSSESKKSKWKSLFNLSLNFKIQQCQPHNILMITVNLTDCNAIDQKYGGQCFWGTSMADLPQLWRPSWLGNFRELFSDVWNNNVYV